MALAAAVSLAHDAAIHGHRAHRDRAAGGRGSAVAMAVSPIYLESLKTYEHFADSDSLFQKAVEQVRLRALLGARRSNR